MRYIHFEKASIEWEFEPGILFEVTGLQSYIIVFNLDRACAFETYFGSCFPTPNCFFNQFDKYCTAKMIYMAEIYCYLVHIFGAPWVG